MSNIVPDLEATPVPEGLRLWWFGGPSLAIKTPRATVYLDPYYCQRSDNSPPFLRAIPNVFYPDTVTHADLIISTHDHGDHCDQPTLAPMVAHTAARLAFAPSSLAKAATWPGFPTDRITAMAPGATLTVGDVTLTAEPCRDWSDPQAVTYVLQSQGLTVFLGADTLYFAGLEGIGRRYSVDLAVFALARNRRDIIDAELYLDPPALVRAAQAVGTRRVLPIHWDIWEAWVEDPQALRAPLEGTGIELLLLGQGQSYALAAPR